MHANAIGLCLALVIFFIGFNYLEGSLPSMISRRAPPDQKGAALGVYATSQFLGGFAGGTLGGFPLGDRKSVGWGTRVSVRVDRGGGRIIKKNKRYTTLISTLHLK